MSAMTERAKTIVVETYVSDLLDGDVDILEVSEYIGEEFPGLTVTDEDLDSLTSRISREMRYAKELWEVDGQ